ncbi:helix-turn-helix domain-containing protein [Microbacterium sp. No. 7]|uniref:helix-turn-helix domain-containing protein n=1 Tax=Microbacterium sp. No. 7 TaxID=1714373 RepID=UPI0006D150DF|nr:helix-turn-helix domain-containing protein [Microbacterium sp. No. 7]
MDGEGFGVVGDTLTSHLPWAIEADGLAGLGEGTSRTRCLGDLRLVTARFGPGRFHRRSRELAMTDGEYVGVVLVRDGTELVGQGDRQVSVSGGAALAWDSVRGAECRIPAPVAKHVVLVPRSRFLGVAPRPEAITMRPIAASSATRLLGSLLDGAAEGPGLDAHTAAATGGAVVELLRAVCAQELPVPASWEDSALLLFARRHIQENLSDTQLDPARIARVLGVSRRRLYEVFSSTGEPVAACIRRLRLSRAHQEVSRCPPVKQIAEIAREVGFTDPAHFARSFRVAYGESPRDLRQRLGSAA